MSERQYRILVIDDNPEDRHTYGRFLTKYCPDEYAVLEASSGQDGLRLCRSGQPHCVLLDYRLPDRNGLELLNELAHENGNLARAVIMLTGQGDEALAVQAMKAGAQDYLIKGRINADVLGRAIQNAIGKVALLRQIEEQRRELERLATTDSLTGLYNRRRFFEKLNEELARLRRYGGALSILLVDIDQFKSVNDTYGHLVGDRVLAEVGQTLRSGLRETDLAARFTGAARQPASRDGAPVPLHLADRCRASADWHWVRARLGPTSWPLSPCR